MTNDEFLEQVIKDRITEVLDEFTDNDPITQAKREGALTGLKLCKNKTSDELSIILSTAIQNTRRTFIALGKKEISILDYFRTKQYEDAIRWVCSCLSAKALSEGQGLIINPSQNAILKVTEILGTQIKG